VEAAFPAVLNGGKSDESLEALGSRALDGDMAARIARHRAERPARWATIEEPHDVPAACRRAARSHDVVVVDCVTVWVSNLMERGDDDAQVLAAVDDLAKMLRERLVSVILVSNEVGQGVHPPTELGRRFRDLLGLVNQRLAAAADRVTLMVAALPLTVKDTPLPSPPHVRPHEAP